MRSYYSILEQVSGPAGSFIFFILASRLVGSENFGEFSKIFISSQIIYTISAHWIIVPITSTRININEKNLYSSSLTRLFAYTSLIPFITCIFYYLFGSNAQISTFIINVFSLSLGLISYDLLRFYNIRIREVSKQFKINVLRWCISLFLVIFMYIFIRLESFYYIVSLSYIAGLLPAFIKQLFIVNDIKPSIFLSKARPIENYTEHSQTMASLGLSGALFTVITTILFSRIGTSALGAIQAFRSIVNLIPLAVQYIETHFSAERLHSNNYKFLNYYWYLFFISFSLIALILLHFYSEDLILLVLGSSYSNYSTALLLVFMIAMAQSALRILGAQARLINQQQIFRYQVYILALSSILLFFISFTLKINLDVNTLLFLITLVTSIQGSTMFYMLNKYQNK